MFGKKLKRSKRVMITAGVTAWLDAAVTSPKPLGKKLS